MRGVEWPVRSGGAGARFSKRDQIEKSMAYPCALLS